MVDGTVDLSAANAQAKDEVFEPDEELLEIERKQEAQRMALAHGGFNDLIDFEEAIKQGHGKDFHAKHGFPGMMGGSLPKKDGDAPKESSGKKEEEDPIRRILKAQQESQRKEAEQPKMMKTGEGGQVVFEATETGHPKTPIADATPTPEVTPLVEDSEDDGDDDFEMEEEEAAVVDDAPTEPLETSNAGNEHILKDEL